MEQPKNAYLSVKDLSISLGVDPKTIRRWIARGRIKAFQFGGKGGKLIIPLDEATWSSLAGLNGVAPDGEKEP